ncbi:unnamed protein product [Mucor hiemalis]
MPYIFCETPSPANTPSSTFERFQTIIEKYKSLVESNDTARCMIGFTAASFIRNEGDVDVDSLESWLQSMDFGTPSLDDDPCTTQVDRILNFVMSNAAEYTSDDCDTEDEEDVGTNNVTEEDEDAFKAENEEVYELNRFISRNPYSLLGSYPVYTYHPRVSFVKQSEDNSIHFMSAPLR